VIDVRGNGGGATPFRLMTALMNRTRRPWQQSPARDLPPQSPADDAYGGRVFVLVDRFCGSACEDFVMPFKDTARGVIVGETTQGSSGNPFRADLGNGMRVAIGAVRYRFPDGTPFEGVGIDPDVPIERRLSDIAAARDAVLERARALADSPR
jgi:carboxyl-terminal processing protease